MPQHILHHAPTDLYIEYSTVVDAPTTVACTREEMLDYLTRTNGRHDAPLSTPEAIQARLDRAKERGCSALWARLNLDAALVANRAGRDETEMSVAQFVQYFFVERKGAEEPSKLPIGEVVRDDLGDEIIP